jgi:hypothetical protein
MKWSILILTQPKRAECLKKLLAMLDLQTEPFPDVEIVVKMFDSSMQVSGNRQQMVEDAKGEYVSFIDDDDLVATDYVSKIYSLLDGVDYIGFEVRTTIDGTPTLPAYHSLKYPQWYGDTEGNYRDFSHLNPIRRELAVQAKFTGPFPTEDVRWAEDLRRLGIVKTEHYLPEVMYFYDYRSNK